MPPPFIAANTADSPIIRPQSPARGTFSNGPTCGTLDT
jgi:hypothetical protein